MRTGVEWDDADGVVADDDVLGLLVTAGQDPLARIVGDQTCGQEVFRLSAVNERIVVEFDLACEIFSICILEFSDILPHE